MKKLKTYELIVIDNIKWFFKDSKNFKVYRAIFCFIKHIYLMYYCSFHVLVIYFNLKIKFINNKYNGKKNLNNFFMKSNKKKN